MRWESGEKDKRDRNNEEDQRAVLVARDDSNGKRVHQGPILMGGILVGRSGRRSSKGNIRGATNG